MASFYASRMVLDSLRGSRSYDSKKASLDFGGKSRGLTGADVKIVDTAGAPEST